MIQLANECWLHVFSFIDSVETLSRIARSGSKACWLVRGCDAWRNLTLKWPEEKSVFDGPLIDCLNQITSVNVLSDSLIQVLEWMPNLRNIQVRAASRNHNERDNNVAIQLAQYLTRRQTDEPQLQFSLNVSHWLEWNDEAMMQLHMMPSHLNLTGTKVSAPQLAQFLYTAKHQNRLYRLEYFTCHYADLLWRGSTVLSAIMSLQTLIVDAVQLKCVDLTGTFFINERILQSLSNYSLSSTRKHTLTLIVRDCDQLTASEARAAINKSLNIESNALLEDHNEESVLAYLQSFSVAQVVK